MIFALLCHLFGHVLLKVCSGGLRHYRLACKCYRGHAGYLDDESVAHHEQFERCICAVSNSPITDESKCSSQAQAPFGEFLPEGFHDLEQYCSGVV